MGTTLVFIGAVWSAVAGVVAVLVQRRDKRGAGGLAVAVFVGAFMSATGGVVASREAHAL
jgi:preprotein translocase subunit SecG